jgi:hypothetical protein
LKTVCYNAFATSKGAAGRLFRAIVSRDALNLK